MPTARQNQEYQDRRSLNDKGWELAKKDGVAFHSGHETLQHFMAKALVAYRLQVLGYRVDSEVRHESGNAVDVLGYGCDGRYPIGVEVETDLDPETKKKKLEQYAGEGQLSDVFFVEATDVPTDFEEGYRYIKQQVM